MEGKIIRDPEEVRNEWLSIALMPVSMRPANKGPDSASREIRHLQVQMGVAEAAEEMGLAPVGKEAIADMAEASLRGPQPVASEPTQQELSYGEIIDELLETGRAGKFAESLIASISTPRVRDNVATLFVVKLAARRCFPRARTAVMALAFANPLARFSTAMFLASVTDENADLNLARSLVSAISPNDSGRISAYLYVFCTTRFHGDLLMAKAEADASQPFEKAHGRVVIAMSVGGVEETAAAWHAIKALERGEKKTLLVLQMMTIIVRWAVGGYELPKLPDSYIQQMIADVPVKSWRDHLVASITQVREQQKK